MDKHPADLSNRITSASPEDIRHILGFLDGEKLVDVMALRPTIEDVEEASLWMAGDADVFGTGKPLLTADDDEEPRPQA